MWGTLFPEAVCLVEEQDKTAGLWEARAEARAEGSKQQPGTLGEEAGNFLIVLEGPQKLRGPACFQGRSAYRPDAPLFAVNPMFDPREGGGGASSRRVRPSVSGMA